MTLKAIWEKVRVLTASPSVLEKVQEALTADGWKYESQQICSSGAFGQARAHVWEKITAPDGRTCESMSGLKRNGTDQAVHAEYQAARRAYITAQFKAAPQTPVA